MKKIFKGAPIKEKLKRFIYHVRNTGNCNDEELEDGLINQFISQLDPNEICEVDMEKVERIIYDVADKAFNSGKKSMTAFTIYRDIAEEGVLKFREVKK